MQRVQCHNLQKKFEIGEIIEFAGHMISATGIRPDDKKYDAIKNFPRPTDIKSLRAEMQLLFTRPASISNLDRS